MININYAELHAPIFLSGTNMGIKLDPRKRPGLKMMFNPEYSWLEVKYKDETSWIPSTNVVSMVAGERIPDVEQVSHPQVASIASAQVETPYGHVHAGLGHGKKGK